MSPEVPMKFLDAVTVTERLGDVAKFQERLEADPADLMAGSRLEQIYRAEERWEELIELLLERAESAASADEAAAALSEIATIYQDRLHDAEAARVVLLEAFKQDPGNAGIADTLDALAYATGQWDDVLDAYLVSAAKQDIDDKGAGGVLWLRIACAHLASTGDLDSVNEALERVQRLDPVHAGPYLDMVEHVATSPKALHTLAAMCERVGDQDRLVRVLGRSLDGSQDRPTRAASHARLGALHLERDDLQSAEWHFIEAMRLNDANPEAREGLLSIYKERGEYRKITQLLEQARAGVANTKDKSSLAYEAATLYAEELDEATMAADLFKLTLQNDPEHVGAAVPLAARYFSEQRWQELLPLAELMVRHLDRLPEGAPAPVEVLSRAGQALLETGDAARARGRFEAAIDRSLEHAPALLGLARACEALADHEVGLAANEALLSLQQREGVSAAEVAETFFRMGRAYHGLGDTGAATQHWERAISVGGFHEKALNAAVASLASAGDWRGIVELRCAAYEHADDAQRVVQLYEVANLTSRQLGDPRAAIEYYQRALELQPGHRGSLHQLIEHYSAAEMWREAAKAMVQSAEVEPDPIRRGKYYQAAGTVCRHQLTLAEAEEHFNRALDCFFIEAPSLPETLRSACFKAFTDLGKDLYEKKDWKTLERNYRMMIKRLPSEAPELAELWHGLGQLYRKHLNQADAAIGSFEIASELDEDRMTHHRILVDLYQAQGPEQIDKAIGHRLKLVYADPTDADNYRALSGLWAKQKAVDRVWCAVRVLVYLGQANEDELDFFSRLWPTQIRWPQRPMTEEMWNRLRHEGENPRLSQILGFVSTSLASELAATPKRLGLRDDPSPAFFHLRQLFGSVAYAMGVRQPDVYVQPEVGGDILLANVRKGKQLAPSFAIGATLYQGKSLHAITNTIARTSSYLRPGYFLRLVFPGRSELEAAFLAASTLSRRDVPVPPPIGNMVAAYAQSMRKRMDPLEQQYLAHAVAAFVSEGRPYELDDWRRAIDMTARRAALLLCGDLHAAIEGVTRGAAGPEVLATDERVRDLVLHSISEEHFALRRALGVDCQ